MTADLVRLSFLAMVWPFSISPSRGLALAEDNLREILLEVCLFSLRQSTSYKVWNRSALLMRMLRKTFDKVQRLAGKSPLHGQTSSRKPSLSCRAKSAETTRIETDSQEHHLGTRPKSSSYTCSFFVWENHIRMLAVTCYMFSKQFLSDTICQGLIPKCCPFRYLYSYNWYSLGNKLAIQAGIVA